jgi:hypothetical protein
MLLLHAILMRLLIFLIITFFVSCKNSPPVVENTIAKTMWLNSDLRFDTARLDNMVMNIHGSGIILSFDSAAIFKSFSNEFYTDNDTLFWGEPGIEMFYGKWHKEGDKLIVDKELIERTILLLSQPIGTKQVDTFRIIGDTLVRNDGTKYRPFHLVSKEIKDLLNRDWSKWREKNGM